MSRLYVEVPGVAAPKGSLRHVGHGRLVEQVARSKPWRQTVAAALRQAAREQHWTTATGAVSVQADLLLPRPKSAPRRLWPITRSSGDVDKHGRNILDALVDAGVVRDDSQVVSLRVTKAYDVGEPMAILSIDLEDS